MQKYFSHCYPSFCSSLFATSNFLYIFNSSAGPLVNRKYKIVGFLMNEIEFRPFEKIRENSIISVRFDPSPIELVPKSFIDSCNSEFFLPPRVKRVYCNSLTFEHPDVFLSCPGNKFVSVIGKKNLLNHHPLEIVTRVTHRSRISFRETVRIICVGHSSIC